MSAQRYYFDLDGTLTDPKEGITRSIQSALERLNIEPPAQDDLLWCIGPPLHGSLAKLTSSALADKALALYRERFADVGWQENHVYDGIEAMLTALSSEGARLYVATSKPKVYAIRIVEHFGLSPFFRAVYGPELNDTAADKTNLLAHALAAEDDPGTNFMIGDRHHDVVGGKNNSMNTIAVSYGYGSASELANAEPDFIAHSPADITRHLLESNNKSTN